MPERVFSHAPTGLRYAGINESLTAHIISYENYMRWAMIPTRSITTICDRPLYLTWASKSTLAENVCSECKRWFTAHYKE